MLLSKDLTFSYSSNKRFSFPDLSCADGNSLLILGQSGRGKTTLLHLLALLLRPETGEIIVNGTSTTQLSIKEMAHFRAQHIGIVYQKGHFVSSLTVLENLLLPNYLANKILDKERALYLASQLGFTEHLHKKTNQMSQGEQQRVSIARALMNNPSVILADEPTSALDDANCTRVIDLLKEQSAQIGASLIVVTHDQRLKDEISNQIIL